MTEVKHTSQQANGSVTYGEISAYVGFC